MLTIEEINAMSDEELAEANKKLAVKAMTRYGLLMAAKWAVIFGAIHYARKSIERSMKEADV